MTVITANDVTFGYERGAPVLRDVTVEIGPGVTVLLGPNGAGKSTLTRLLIGVARPWRGRIEIDGAPIGTLGVRRRARRLAFVAQRPEVAAAFSVREVVGLGRFAVGRNDGAIDRALERMDLGALASRAFGELSVGQRQRVTIARALAQLDGGEGSGALIADEPFSAMDPAYCRDGAGVVRGLAREGASVLLVLHDFTLASRIADRVILLDAEGACERPWPEGGGARRRDAGARVRRRVPRVRCAGRRGPHSGGPWRRGPGAGDIVRACRATSSTCSC